MTRPRPRGHRDPLGRHPSTARVASLVAGLLPLGPRRTILDLCSGDGALGAAVTSLHPDATLVSVDVDPASRPPEGGPNAHRRFHLDALSLDLLPHLPHGPVDLALCNPPFGSTEAVPSHVDLLRSAGLAPPAFASRPSLEWLFLARCLSVARPGGVVALLVPDALATGAAHRSVRTALLAAHGLHVAATLPRGGFRGADPTVHVLVVVARRPSHGPFRLVDVRSDGSTASVDVSRDAAVRRLDHRYHAVPPSPGTTLRELGAEVSRGLVDSPRRHPRPVFHVTAFPSIPDRRRAALPEVVPPGGSGVAGPGDILVARLGRGLGRNVCGVSSGAIEATSAVHVVRMPVQHRDRVLDQLLSPQGASVLARACRGSGVSVLSKTALLDVSVLTY